MHLAQLNVAHLIAPIDGPELADFVAALEPVYAIADSAPGFVWRMKRSDDPTEVIVHEYGDDLLVNVSIWESREALWNFVYRSPHLELLRRRREWFLRTAVPYTLMWWVPEGHTPTLGEAMERLESLRTRGPGPEAFTFKEFYEPGASEPSLP
ncbi:DUF3291 domain-containing protein [Planotetraspora kaengkrachanensis]|uniref:DUF3291 domain-containing protein n=1 Tax=Planotetraspora kaengkrachanensis TaxID=575193 RepID=A0A8J3PYQ1_9ACTN|nr:DUF3291 domain-containing protein [Planotetraspora kaengkrachanensis]GIG83313.1 hypothetical protein Pka01_64400 [Planotetraspora kaengkrachanensis]